MSNDATTLSWDAAPGHGPEVLYASDGPLVRIRLNRPKAINALDRAMIDSLHQQLQVLAEDDAVAAVVLDGAGERGLCAGGDVRALREAVVAGRPEEARAYWAAEYAVDGLIATYPKPFVAWMDGIVMGGGVGVSTHGAVRLVTERTQLAMPEVIIGFFPDVGALWFLTQTAGEIGTHVALTGAPVGGADAVALGMADALVPADSFEQVLAALRADPSIGAQQLAAAVGAKDTAASWFEQQRSWIDACYVGDDATQIVARLRERPEEEAQEAAQTISSRSPHSVAVTLEALRRAASMSVQQVLAQDTLLGPAFARHPDFAEGVRAQLIDKDRQPAWAHSDVSAVTRAEVLAAFGETGT